MRTAARHFRAALSFTPDEHWTLEHLAWAEAGSGRRAAAVRYARNAATTGDARGGDRLVSIVDRCDAADTRPAVVALVVVAVGMVQIERATSSSLLASGLGLALAAVVLGGLRHRRRTLLAMVPQLAATRALRRLRTRSRQRALVLAAGCFVATFVTAPTKGRVDSVSVPVIEQSQGGSPRSDRPGFPASTTLPVIPSVDVVRVPVRSSGTDFGYLPWVFGLAGVVALVGAGLTSDREP